MFKCAKRILVCVVVLGGLGAVVAASGLSSYVKSSGRMIRTAVKDSIPIEFEIQRAKDLLDELVPELRANLRLVAAEEVEVANLQREIEAQNERVENERSKVKVLRTTLNRREASYRIGQLDYGHEELVQELSTRFDRLLTAERLFDSRKELLNNRRRSLEAAIQKLEKTRLTRVQLEAEIEQLEGHFHLLQAQSAESGFAIDDSKLAKTRQVIKELRKKLDVAQRVLAREAKFVETIPIELIDAGSVVDQVDAYFADGPKAVETAVVNP